MKVALAALIVGLVLGSGCVHAPPELAPAAHLAWTQHEIQKALDLVRDIAQDGADMTPPVISVAAARYVTVWHRTAIQIVHDAPAGWQQQVAVGLMGLKDGVPSDDYARVRPYVDIAMSLLRSR